MPTHPTGGAASQWLRRGSVRGNRRVGWVGVSLSDFSDRHPGGLFWGVSMWGCRSVPLRTLGGTPKENLK